MQKANRERPNDRTGIKSPGGGFFRPIKQGFGRWLIPKLPIRRVLFNEFRREINAVWVKFNGRLNPSVRSRVRRLKNQHGLSVNIGCGPFGREGWVNLDLMKHDAVTLRWDCRKALPLSRHSVARIRCEHFFEHLDYREEVPLFLKSCYDVLEPGGVLRIVVPDAGRFLTAYGKGDGRDWADLGWDLERLPPDLETRMDIINHVFRQGEEHLYAYDFETLKNCFLKAGFKEIEKVGFGISRDPGLRDDLPNHKLHSLYAEAVKG